MHHDDVDTTSIRCLTVRRHSNQECDSDPSRNGITQNDDGHPCPSLPSRRHRRSQSLQLMRLFGRGCFIWRCSCWCATLLDALSPGGIVKSQLLTTLRTTADNNELRRRLSKRASNVVAGL